MTEGHTERIYFQGLRCRKNSVRIVTPISKPTDALNLVRLCADQMESKGIDIDDGDIAICVFDIEGNDDRNLARAIKMAEESGIMLAMTNPCFELWFLLHFIDMFSCVPCKKLHDMLKGHIEGYSKTKDYRTLLEPRRHDALTRATRLWDKMEGQGVMVPSNPGTSMHIVVRRIERIIKHNHGG